MFYCLPLTERDSVWNEQLLYIGTVSVLCLFYYYSYQLASLPACHEGNQDRHCMSSFSPTDIFVDWSTTNKNKSVAIATAEMEQLVLSRYLTCFSCLVLHLLNIPPYLRRQTLMWLMEWWGLQQYRASQMLTWLTMWLMAASQEMNRLTSRLKHMTSAFC